MRYKCSFLNELEEHIYTNEYNTKHKQENIYTFIRHTGHYIRSKLTSRKIIEKNYINWKKCIEKQNLNYTHFNQKEERYRAYILRFYWRILNIFFLHFKSKRNWYSGPPYNFSVIQSILITLFCDMKWWFQPKMNFYVNRMYVCMSVGARMCTGESGDIILINIFFRKKTVWIDCWININTVFAWSLTAINYYWPICAVDSS